MDKSGGLGCGSVTVWMLDKFKEEEQTFLSTSPDSSDFEELPPDVTFSRQPGGCDQLLSQSLGCG